MAKTKETAPAAVSGLLCGSGQGDSEAGSVALGELNLPAVRLHQPPDDGQPQAGAAGPGASDRLRSLMAGSLIASLALALLAVLRPIRTVLRLEPAEAVRVD